jgi:hypothetical protein
MHPKNSQRTDAIKGGHYVEINTNEDAVSYLSDMLSVNL